MAISSRDQVLAGLRPPEDFFKIGAATVVGRLYSTLYAQGRPGAAVPPECSVSGEALLSHPGQIPWNNPVAGSSYLARFVASCNVPGSLMLCDRLWHNAGLNPTLIEPQTVGSKPFPARDADGTDAGRGIMIGVEVSQQMGTGMTSFTMEYTNSKGEANRKSTAPMQASALGVGSFVPMPLAPGDVGVRSVQGWSQSGGMVSGAYHLVAYRVLAFLPLPQANVGQALDPISGGFPRLYDNTVPFLLWLPATTTAPYIAGQMIVAQG